MNWTGRIREAVISGLSRIFLTVLFLLTAAFAVVVADAVTATPPETLQQVTAVTHLPGVSLSVSYFEPRLPHYADGSEGIHPGLEPANHQNFLHGQ